MNAADGAVTYARGEPDGGVTVVQWYRHDVTEQSWWWIPCVRSITRQGLTHRSTLFGTTYCSSPFDSTDSVI